MTYDEKLVVLNKLITMAVDYIDEVDERKDVLRYLDIEISDTQMLSKVCGSKMIDQLSLFESYLENEKTKKISPYEEIELVKQLMVIAAREVIDDEELVEVLMTLAGMYDNAECRMRNK